MFVPFVGPQVVGGAVEGEPVFGHEVQEVRRGSWQKIGWSGYRSEYEKNRRIGRSRHGRGQARDRGLSRSWKGRAKGRCPRIELEGNGRMGDLDSTCRHQTALMWDTICEDGGMTKARRVETVL